jgi:hypothetical protein
LIGQLVDLIDLAAAPEVAADNLVFPFLGALGGCRARVVLSRDEGTH